MIEETTFENGLKIVTEQLLNSNYIAIFIGVASGSRADIMPYQGLAHFLEHALFLGTTSKSGREIRKMEQEFGLEIEAETTGENIFFSSACLPADFEKLFSLMGDIVMNPSFNAEDISQEKQVILSEIAQTDLTIDNAINTAMNRVAYGAHPLGFSIHGRKSIIKAIQSEQLRAYHQTNFQPQNIIVSVVGDTSHQNVCNLCKKVFNAKGAHPLPDRQTPPVYFGGEKHLEDSFQNTQFCFAFNGIPIKNVSDYALSQVLVQVIGDSMYETLVRGKGLLYDIDAQNSGYADCGLFAVKGACLPSKTKTVFKACADFIAGVEKQITPERLLSAKKQLKLTLNPNPASFEGKAKSHAFDLRYFQHFVPWTQYEEEINALPIEKVRQAAKDIFASKLTYCTLGDKRKIPPYKQMAGWICAPLNINTKTHTQNR